MHAGAAGAQKVKIAIDDILEKYECPICMCKLNEPYIAKCGHTFCKVGIVSLLTTTIVHIVMYL
jgi:hypothetical protein